MIPPLTTIQQPIYDKGKVAVNLLLDQLEGKSDTPIHTMLQPELIIRETCGAIQIPQDH